MKAIDFQIDEISFAEGKLKLTCFNQDLPEGVPFTIDIPPKPYPEGRTVDRLIETHAPRTALADALRQQGNAISKPAATPSGMASILGVGMQFVVEHKEKIFLIQPLTMIRRHPIPVEVY